MTSKQIGWHQQRGVFTDLQENPIVCVSSCIPGNGCCKTNSARTLLEARLPLVRAALEGPVEQQGDPGRLVGAVSQQPLPVGDLAGAASRGQFRARSRSSAARGPTSQIFEHGKLSLKTEGPYDGPSVYQELWPLPHFEQKYFAVIGSWIVNGWSCGIGIREDESRITGNLSRFLPHLY